MDVTIIGTGNMAEGISARLLSGGNNITLLGHKPHEADELINRLSSSSARGAAAKAATPGNPIEGEIVILAIPYSAVSSAVKDYSRQLQGKIVIDITNPLNQSYDGLVTKPGTSAAEEIARLLPQGTRLVKAFNTTFAGTLKKGEVAGQKLDVFVAGDDAEAKKTVINLVSSGAMRAIDAGPLQRARDLEALAFLLISLQGTMKTNFMSIIKILE